MQPEVCELAGLSVSALWITPGDLSFGVDLYHVPMKEPEFKIIMGKYTCASFYHSRRPGKEAESHAENGFHDRHTIDHYLPGVDIFSGFGKYFLYFCAVGSRTPGGDSAADPREVHVIAILGVGNAYIYGGHNALVSDMLYGSHKKEIEGPFLPGRRKSQS